MMMYPKIEGDEPAPATTLATRRQRPRRRDQDESLLQRRAETARVLRALLRHRLDGICA